MKRGDLVTVSAPGDYGKPRPAVVVQSDWLDATDSVLVCLVTSTLRDAPIFRLTVEPSPGNGLKTTSQIMVDKIVALRREKCGAPIGHLGPAPLMALGQMLSVVLGIAD
ncbi:type II toxin-antitoxin system PemK/MazF family toxin [Methylobacterium durans]|uniref:Growth inhibitor PemK n=1 Tax=Methylobacterium durans TaxID=2202825 RepID=A0A2U8W825_9HYPH|nr:type II toxin-antitoxin system PemK/MazF family toxin [Methylobacterium durans]AWN42179.1 growth inhibitor PemK [Methylobacterium durans]